MEWLGLGRGRSGAIHRKLTVDYTYGVRQDSVFDYGVASRGPVGLSGNIDLTGYNVAVEADVYIESLNHDTALSIIAGRETSYESDSDFGMPVTMEYILFDSNGAEQPDTAGQNRNLKVTVESPGENLTTILSQSRTSSKQPPILY